MPCAPPARRFVCFYRYPAYFAMNVYRDEKNGWLAYAPESLSVVGHRSKKPELEIISEYPRAHVMRFVPEVCVPGRVFSGPRRYNSLLSSVLDPLCTATRTLSMSTCPFVFALLRPVSQVVAV